MVYVGGGPYPATKQYIAYIEGVAIVAAAAVKIVQATTRNEELLWTI